MEATFSYYTGLDKALKYSLGAYSEVVSRIKTFQNMWIIFFHWKSC